MGRGAKTGHRHIFTRNTEPVGEVPPVAPALVWCPNDGTVKRYLYPIRIGLNGDGMGMVRCSYGNSSFLAVKNS